MQKMGYTNSWDVLQAMDFSIPQSRERLFCVSILGREVFDFTKLKKRPMHPLEEFLQPEGNIDLGKCIVVQVLEAIFEVIFNEDYSSDFLTDDTGQLQLIC